MKECTPPQLLLVLTRQPDQPDEQVIEVTLTTDGDETILVWEERGMPLNLVAAYGAGVQVHVEDLAAYPAGVSLAMRTPGSMNSSLPTRDWPSAGGYSAISSVTLGWASVPE